MREGGSYTQLGRKRGVLVQFVIGFVRPENDIHVAPVERNSLQKIEDLKAFLGLVSCFYTVGANFRCMSAVTIVATSSIAKVENCLCKEFRDLLRRIVTDVLQ